MKRTIILFCNFFLLFNLLSSQESTLINLEAEILDILNFFTASEPGGVVLVAKEEDLLYQNSFGKANLELDVDLQFNHVFPIASCTKPFTAVAILKLVEEGKISLQDELSQFIDEFPNHKYAVNIAHLLSHTSGIANYNDDMEAIMQLESQELSPEEFMALFKDKPLEFIPGQQFSYSNTGYFLLGQIIEKVTQKSFEDYLKEIFFTPLQMKNTSVNDPSKVVEGRASGYDQLYGNTYSNKRYESKSFSGTAAGGLISTAQDLFIWYTALMDGEIINIETLEKAMKPYRLSNNKASKTGYAWEIGNLLGSPFISHNGGTWGFGSSLVYFPEERVFVVVLSNCLYCSWKMEDFFFSPFKIAGVVLGKPYKERPSISLDQAMPYEGIFKSASGDSITLMREGNQLFLIEPNGTYIKTYPYQVDQFYLELKYSTITLDTLKEGQYHTLSIIKGDTVSYNRLNKPLPKRSLARNLKYIMDKEGLEKGIEFYSLSSKNEAYYLSEKEMNEAGYHFLHSGQYHLALEFFLINVEVYPDSFNVYDSLGEAYMRMGEYEKAIDNYKLSIKINPKNDHGKLMIGKINALINKR